MRTRRRTRARDEELEQVTGHERVRQRAEELLEQAGERNRIAVRTKSQNPSQLNIPRTGRDLTQQNGYVD